MAMQAEPALRIRVPAWQISVVLLLLPALFLVNARMPWTHQLGVDHDRARRRCGAGGARAGHGRTA